MTNLLFYFTIFSLAFSQNYNSNNLLDLIKEQSASIGKQNDPNLEKKFSQAKSLEKVGSIDEAILLYKQINYTSNGDIRYFTPLKKLLKQSNAKDTLLLYTNIFCDIRNDDFISQLELLDVYIFIPKNDLWKKLANKLIFNSKLDERSIKKVFHKLISLGEYDFTYSLLQNYRKSSNKKDFYSIELGSYFTTRMAFEKATKEYLLFLESNPKQIKLISDRIMSFPNEATINIKIKSILNESTINGSKIILSDFHFKLKEFNQAYKILIDENASLKLLTDFAEGLINVEEYDKAEEIFNHIIKQTNDDRILTKSIFAIAYIFESKMSKTYNELPLSGFYPNNLFFSSPYIPLKEESSYNLQMAIEIYDSLRITKKNAQAAYRLAEVQFKVIGDLDHALYLYSEALKHGNTKNLRIDSGIGIINIYIAKGDLHTANIECEKLINLYPNDIIFQVKSIQISFYNGEFDQTKTNINNILKNLSMEQNSVNDILDISNILIVFQNNKNLFKKYTSIQLSIQQNKRVEALDKLKYFFEINDKYLSNMCIFQYAWLTFLQGDIENTKKHLRLINGDTIFSELSQIFLAEIFDYIDNNISVAIDSYLNFLDIYPQSIYYDEIRLRLRVLAS